MISAGNKNQARADTYPLTEKPGDKCEIDFEPSNSDDASVVKKYEVRTGLTKFLGQEPGTALRKIDVVDVQEPVFTTVEQKEAKYFGPRKLLIESFAPGASEHMRFLGISIKGKSGEFVDESVGVIRLTRTGSAAPFSEADEVLLRMLGEVARPFFEHEASRRPQVAKNTYEIEDLVTRLTLRPPQSIPAFPGRARIAAVLEDLNDLCREIYRDFQKTKLGDKAKSGESSGDFKNPVVLSSIRFVVEHDSPISVGLRERFLHVHTMQPTWSSETASEDDGEGLPHPRHLDANGWTALDEMRPLTFACEKDPSKNDQRFHKVHSLTKWVRSGCCYPFVVHQDNKIVHGILSIDFACSETQLNGLWGADLLPAIRLAVTKVKWLFENGAQHLSTEQLPTPDHLTPWDDNQAREAWTNRKSEYRFQESKSSQGKFPNTTLWDSPEIGGTPEVEPGITGKVKPANRRRKAKR